MISSSPTERGCCPKCGSHEYLDDVGAVPYCINKKCSCHHSTTQKKETCPECQFEQPRYPHEKSAHQKDCSRAQKKECCAKARQEGYDDGRLSAIRDGLAKKELAEEETPKVVTSKPIEQDSTTQKPLQEGEVSAPAKSPNPTTLSRIDEELKDKYVPRILDILILQQKITNQGWNYEGEKDVALNAILKLIKDDRSSLLSEIEERIEAGKQEIPTNELKDIVLALRADSPEVLEHRRIRDDKLFCAHLKNAAHNAALDSASEVVRSFKI